MIRFARELLLAISVLAALAARTNAQIWIFSPANQTGHGISTPLVPCGAGTIDLSLATGCNLQFYLNGVFP